MLIKAANVFLPQGIFQKCDVRFSDTIEEIGSVSDTADINATGCYLIPGLIDIHTHGALGFDFSDGQQEQLPAMAQHYARHGITSFLATTMTLSEDILSEAAHAIGSFVPGENESRCIGINLEGPFLSYEKRGAQNADYLHVPDFPMFDRIDQASGGHIRLVDIAPELPGADAFIKQASKRCAVSLAHTAADYDTAVHAYVLGATHVTHLFNGMSAFHHRNPGVVGAAMDQRAYAEVVCDGIHLHPSVVRAAFAMFPNRITLISDSLRCAGMPEGEYILGGQNFTLKNGKATLSDGTIAGSRITLLEGLQNAVQFGIPLTVAVAAATINPAQAIRMADKVGCIAVGRCADLLLLDKDLQPKAIFLRGHQYQE
ncbi:MAG: N-acetylglucosamine-6-phosphate deacetylase [Clostridia bacterium]